MITIIVDTKKEYDEMMEIAQEYVCRQIDFKDCTMHKTGGCVGCFNSNHAICGIRVDINKPDEL